MKESRAQARGVHLINAVVRHGQPLPQLPFLHLPDGRMEGILPGIGDGRHERPISRVRAPSEHGEQVFRHTHIVVNPQEPVGFLLDRPLAVEHCADGVDRGVRQGHALLRRQEPHVVRMVPRQLRSQKFVGVVALGVHAAEHGGRQRDDLLVRVRLGRDNKRLAPPRFNIRHRRRAGRSVGHDSLLAAIAGGGPRERGPPSLGCYHSMMSLLLELDAVRAVAIRRYCVV